jgi:hypothetical protein
VASTPSLSDHNHDSEIFVETDGTEDMQLDKIQSGSDGGNTNAPDMTINDDIKPNVNATADQIIPSSEPALSLSGQMNDMPDLARVDANPSAS